MFKVHSWTYRSINVKKMNENRKNFFWNSPKKVHAPPWTFWPKVHGGGMNSGFAVTGGVCSSPSGGGAVCCRSPGLCQNSIKEWDMDGKQHFWALVLVFFGRFHLNERLPSPRIMMGVDAVLGQGRRIWGMHGFCKPAWFLSQFITGKRCISNIERCEV